MGRFLILFGILLIVLGLLWPFLQKAGVGRLPGDILIRREHVVVYLPLATSLLISLIISIIAWLIGR